MWILHSHISFLLFHVPGLILKMILITPTWIVGIIPGVLKTILAISREVYYFPSPERHFRSQPADLCTTQPKCTETSRDSWMWSLHVDAAIPVHQSFSRDTRYQCKASFGRVTKLQSTAIFFLSISKRYQKVWIDTSVIASLFLDLSANTVIMQRQLGSGEWWSQVSICHATCWSVTVIFLIS